ncbi:MAG: YicC family protein [Alphaproteobacteria bacterium]|nr:YicC family protein [Alphaproteobacteria bacterium]
MTGFARAEGEHDGVGWVWEAKSVNSRGLDIRCRLPGGMDSLESDLRVRAQKKFRRGAITLSLTLDRSGSGAQLRLDEEVVAQLAHIVAKLTERINSAPPHLDGLLRVPGVLVTGEAEESKEEREALEETILEGLESAFDGLAAMRESEGEHLGALLGEQLKVLTGLCDVAEKSAASQPESLLQRLQSRIAELRDSVPAVDEERLAQEVAFLAAKADVREELDRLRGHIQAAQELISPKAGSKEAVGRKLDFLCQEFNREANTICSKSADMELTRIGVEIKTVVEQFREQTQNIE